MKSEASIEIEARGKRAGETVSERDKGITMERAQSDECTIDKDESNQSIK